MRRLGAILILVLAAGGPAVAAEKPPKVPPLGQRLGRKISIEFIDTPLLDVVAALGAELKFNSVVDPLLRAEHPKVTLKVKDMTGANVLMTAAREAGAVCSGANGVVSVGYPKFIRRVRRIATPRPFDHHVRLAFRRRIDLDLTDVPLSEVVAALRKELDLNILITPASDDKKDRVTLRMTDVKGGVALKYVALLVGRSARAEHRIVMIESPVVPGQKPKPGPDPDPAPDPEPGAKPKPDPGPFEDDF